MPTFISVIKANIVNVKLNHVHIYYLYFKKLISTRKSSVILFVEVSNLSAFPGNILSLQHIWKSPEALMQLLFSKENSN